MGYKYLWWIFTSQWNSKTCFWTELHPQKSWNMVPLQHGLCANIGQRPTGDIVALKLSQIYKIQNASRINLFGIGWQCKIDFWPDRNELVPKLNTRKHQRKIPQDLYKVTPQRLVLMNQRVPLRFPKGHDTTLTHPYICIQYMHSIRRNAWDQQSPLEVLVCTGDRDVWLASLESLSRSKISK